MNSRPHWTTSYRSPVWSTPGRNQGRVWRQKTPEIKVIGLTTAHISHPLLHLGGGRRVRNELSLGRRGRGDMCGEGGLNFVFISHYITTLFIGTKFS